MNFSYQSIAVFKVNNDTPLLHDILRLVSYCPYKLSLIENILLRDLGKIVLDYMGEDRKVYSFYDPEDPTSVDRMAVSIIHRAHIRNIERKLLNPTQKEKAINQQFDLLVTNLPNLNPVGHLLRAAKHYFLKHIHICDHPLQSNYQGAVELLILPEQSTLWHAQTIAKNWVIGNSRALSDYNHNNDLVIDLRDQKMYYQKPTKEKTKYMDFKSWSFVSLPLK